MTVFSRHVLFDETSIPFAKRIVADNLKIKSNTDNDTTSSHSKLSFNLLQVPMTPTQQNPPKLSSEYSAPNPSPNPEAKMSSTDAQPCK